MHLQCSNSGCLLCLDINDRALQCPHCGELLEIILGPTPDADRLRQTFRDRHSSQEPIDRSGVWRFREFLPNFYARDLVVTLQEGNTPLLSAPRCATYAGLKRLLVKHLGWNPTGSFKDTGMTLGMTQAKYLGAARVACASTGNTAASMSAYAARAGIAARVYLPRGSISGAKLAQSLDYGAEIVEVEGNFDSTLERMLQLSEPEIYFLNSINPFRIEGQKTVIFELIEQLGWRSPDYIVLPGGNLGNAAAFGKALQELKAADLIDRVPRLVIVQAEGANPLVRAWQKGGDRLDPISEPQTAATAIRIGAPRSWKKAVRALRFTAGLCVDVSEEQIADAKAMIGQEGIGCEPASATTLAGIRKLISERLLDRDANVVAMLTGHVLKDPDYIVRNAKISSLEFRASN
ncbi:MAG TPA: threonine synthase [Acidobacteriota bacterium]